MPLVTSKALLQNAQAGHYAVAAFNAENMEMIQAVVSAAEELKAPVIIQTTPSTVRYGGLAYYYANVGAAAREASVPVVLHLDHGSDYDLATRAFRAGYTSIMIDASKLPFEENIALSNKVCEMCSPSGVPVEAELGWVGGKEDDLSSDGDIYTDPEKAAYFAEHTAISSLAVAIGTAHGFYKQTPKLDYERLAEIRKRVSLPLVLHGASGLSDEQVKHCIEGGISKVNFATELRDAFTKGVREVLSGDASVFDPKKYNRAGMEQVKALVQHKIRVCGCDGAGR